MNAKRESPGSWRWLLPTYTLIWVTLALAIYAIFRADGRTMLYMDDGVQQHYVAYGYVCRWAEALLHGRGAQLSFFDFTLAQGGDVLIMLSSYDFLDPVCWLTALLPMGSALTRYTAMLFVKLYLIGPCFAVLCRELEKRD